MKISYLRILTGLVVLAVLAGIAWAAFNLILQPSPVVWAGKGKTLPKDQVINGQALARAANVRKGDAFPFLFEVLYDSNQVVGIDRPSLDKAFNAKPFEVRGFRETEIQMDERTRIFRREYELQFIDGKVDQTIALPTIVVRYQLKNANGYAEKGVVPDPIKVVARLPEDVSDMELRPITDKIVDPSRDRLIGVVGAAGVLLIVIGLVHLFGRTLPRWRELERQRQRGAGGDVFAQAYRSLHHQVARSARPQAVLHQADHLLRLVLADRSQVAWLEEPALAQVPKEIQPVVTTLFEQCQKSYGPDGVGAVEPAQVLGQMDQILAFYFGAGTLRTWKN